MLASKALKFRFFLMTKNGQKISGLALGINSYGALQVEKNNGTIHSIHSGDITLKQ